MSWTQRGSVLEASDAADNDAFGTIVSITPDGNTLVVGASNWEGASGTDRGGAYIYDRNGSSWTQRGSVLEASDAADNDRFGIGVAISEDGNVLAVGAYLWEGGTGTGRGGVYIYDRNGSSWTQRGSVLEASDAADDDNFGTAVALSSDGEQLIVGAFSWEGGTGTNRGGVYIYDRNGSSWTQRGSVLQASDAADDDAFGISLSLSGDGTVLAVGAHTWEGASGTNRGGVYIYDRNGSSWTQRGSVLEASDAADSDAFGAGVSLSKDGAVLAVGAFAWETGADVNRGGVYIYDRNGSSWTQRGSVLQASDAVNSDSFGRSVSLSDRGNVLTVGASTWEGAAGTNIGGVYIYDTSDKILGISSGTYIQTNNSVNLLYGRKSIIDTTAYTLTLNDIILTASAVGIVIATTPYSVTTNNINLLYGRNQIIDVTSFTQTNSDINLVHGYQVVIDTTVFSSTTNAVGLLADRKLIVNVTPYVLTANDILFTHGYHLVVDNSPFTLTNNSINLLFGRKVTVDTTTYILTNNDIAFSRGYFITLNPTVYTLTDNDINLLLNRKLTLDATQYLLTNNDITLSFGRIIHLGSSNYTLTNNDINLLFGRKVTVDATAYSLTNNDIFFLYDRVFNISNVNYTLTNNDISLLFGRKVILDTTQYALTLNDLSLLKGSKITLNPTSYSIDSSLNLLYDRIFSIGFQSYILTLNDLNQIYGYTPLNPIRVISLNSSPKTIYSNTIPKIIIGN